jgi:hypothetical protein
LHLPVSTTFPRCASASSITADALMAQTLPSTEEASQVVLSLTETFPTKQHMERKKLASLYVHTLGIVQLYASDVIGTGKFSVASA